MATRLAVRPYHHAAHAFTRVAVVGHRQFVLQATKNTLLPCSNILHQTCPMNVAGTGPLFMASSTEEQDQQQEQQEQPPGMAEHHASDILPEEIEYLESTFQSSVHDATELTKLLSEQLPHMKPGLVIKLKQAQSDPNEIVRAVATSLSAIMDAQLEEARDMLKDLLEAGEIRKLDSMIGKAARAGKLDAAFFTVLNMNLQEAQRQAAAADQGEAKEGEANRVQILQHVYTRCQEEVEKNVPPGIALLNKLLRTEVDSIRANQLKHYLCPQPNVITTPDGKEVELKGGEPRVLVPPEELVDAIAKAIKQIRTVEKAGGTDPVAAAGMVESCRQVAKEARIVIGENYGIDSDVLKSFEEGLQPVFRPKTPESPYIRGE